MLSRFFGLCAVVALTAALGCTGTQGGLIGNVHGTRIAPPGTGTINYQSTATLPNPYQNPGRVQLPPPPAGVPANVNTSNGWRPAGPVSAATTSASYQLPVSTPAVQIPTNNISVASSTSRLQPGQYASAPAYTASSGGTSPLPGGKPLNDATRLAGGGGQVQPGLPNHSWEYAVRPQIPHTAQNPWPNGPNPNHSHEVYPGGNVVVAGNTTLPPPGGPGQRVAAPAPGTGSGQPQGHIADGWRQRDANAGVPR